MSNKSFKSTPVPYCSKFGDPMSYYILAEDGTQTRVARTECLAHAEESDTLNPQRWFVDEESGLVIRLPRTAKSEKLARENMRFTWREAKHQKRWRERIAEPAKDESGEEITYEPADSFNLEEFMEERAQFEILVAALADLTQEDRELIQSIFWKKKTERQLAPELGLKESKSVNKRKRRVLEILRNNEALRNFFE